MIQRLVSATRRYSVVLLLVFGVVMLSVFISRQFWSVVGPILGVTVGSLLGVTGLLLNRFHTPSSVTSHSVTGFNGARIPITLACLYATSIIVLFRFYTYQRPLLLYVLFGGYAGLIGYQIARGTPTKWVVPQILSLSFFTYWSSQFLFPAGMAAVDTFGYVQGIEEVISTGYIPSKYTIYAGHIAYATEFSVITGLNTKIGYFLLATLLLVGTVLIISVLDRVFPAFTPKMTLYAALIFSTSSWMLGRGMHPNKLNFFYALILLLSSIGIFLFRTPHISFPANRALILGIIVAPALIFGHQFSAGAAMIFLFVIGVFAFTTWSITFKGYGPSSLSTTIFLFVSAYILGVLGNPIHKGPLLGRLADLLLSVFVPTKTGATGGPGRYSELAVDVLFASTAAQIILFTVAILGAVWLFRQSKWEYDFVISWIGVISLFLVISLLTNSVDTAPQRFYGLLVLFGFNVCVGAFFYVIDRRGVFAGDSITINVGRIGVVLLISSFAVASLASPVADKATSPVADELPHYQQFRTSQGIQSEQWTARYNSDILQITPSTTSIPIERTGPKTAKANLTDIDSGTIIMYSELTNRTGVVSGAGNSLGGRQYSFVKSPVRQRDSQIYSNGQEIAFIS